MIRHPGLAEPGKKSEAIVETVDVFPTLVDLCALPLPAKLDGRSLRPQLADPAAPSGKAAHGFWAGNQRTLRTDRWRLIVQKGSDAAAPRIELFDFETAPVRPST